MNYGPATQWRTRQLLKNDEVDVYLLKWQDIHNILSSEKKAGYRGIYKARCHFYFLKIYICQEGYAPKW